MSDTPQAGIDVDAAPLAEIAAMTSDQARQRIDALLKDPAEAGFREKYLEGRAQEKAQFDALHQRLAPAAAEASKNDRVALSIANRFNLPDEIVQQIREAPEVTVSERNRAIAARKVLMSDEAFVKRYLSGDSGARAQMLALNVSITSNLKEG